MKRTQVKASKLPNKPSQLILMALEDLKKASRSKRYIIEMCSWHEPQEDGRCEVCLAGAVMAFSLGVHHQEYTTPALFEPPRVKQKLRALDALREGLCELAFNYLGLGRENGESFSRSIVDYKDDPRRFYAQMRRLASSLAEAGF